MKTSRLVPLWHASILLLALCLPFEFRTLWLSLGGAIGFTDVELLAVVALGLWFAVLIAQRRRPAFPAPLGWPAGALLAVMLLASVLAPSDNLNAFKVTLRWLMGAAAGWMLFDAAANGFPLRRWLQAVTLGGVCVALTALFESVIASQPDLAAAPQVSAFFAAFREQPFFRVGDEIRAAATLSYPTTAAAFLELSLLLAVTQLALVWPQSSRLRRVLWLSLCALMGSGIILTYTRSALIAVLLATALVGFAGRHWAVLRPWRAAAVCGTGTLVVLLLIGFIASPGFRLRLSSEDAREWYRATYTTPALPPLHVNESISVPVTVRNAGLHDWPDSASSRQPVLLTYHWLSPDGQSIVQDGTRASLPSNVSTGKTVTLNLIVNAPNRAGRYLLAWNMLRDKLFLFTVVGDTLRTMPVDILPANSAPNLPQAGAPQPPAPLPVRPARTITNTDTGRLMLWRAAGAMLAEHPLLGVGPGNFRLLYGKYLGQTTWDMHIQANNTIIEVAAGSGLFGGALFVSLVVVMLATAWRGLVLAGQTGRAETAILIAGLLAALLAALLHGLTDYFLDFTPYYLLFWMLVGALAALSAPCVNFCNRTTVRPAQTG